MKYEAYVELTDEQRTPIEPPVLKGSDLQNQRPRTLLYGFTCERNSFHVYLGAYGRITKVEYAYDEDEFRRVKTEDDIRQNAEWVPDKRLYPERCDEEFCRLLKARGIRLPFTNYDERACEEKPFHGRTVE